MRNRLLSPPIQPDLGGFETLAGLERTGEALGHYRAALVHEPDSQAAQDRVAVLLRSMGQNREAAQIMEAILKRNPDSVPTLLALARLYAGPLDRPERGAELALRVLDLQPDNAEARELLAFSRQAAGPP